MRSLRSLPKTLPGPAAGRLRFFRRPALLRARGTVRLRAVRGPPPPPPPPPPPGPTPTSGRSRLRRPGLLDTVLQTPARVEGYFEGSLPRKALWACIAFGGGFYAGNVATLSFGALAINDVLAAAITVVFYEVVTNAFYDAPEKTLRLYFANFFKMGVVSGMLADAIKLGG